ncbi:MAG: hypothetical protein J3K34DRAFT_526031 [Monoraphidium minutum]|nr:MAG: hypothetical protein J3K34DRAFT_526031 [Monoraphidium minutum]
MELFKELKGKMGKIKETFKDVVGELDPAEKRLSDLVERATDAALPGPDLGLNLAVVDEVNGAPDVAIDAITRALRRAFLRPNTRVQLLALALLEMLVKNSVPQFFHNLATSELWAEMLKVGEPTHRLDPEVRDRVLVLVEDWGRGLPLQGYRDAYEGLVDRGVDFPARLLPPDGEGAPYYTPPALPPRPPPAYGAPPVMGAGATFPPPGPAGAPASAGPLIGPDVSAEDAEAIRAVVAEMEAEEASRQMAAAHAAAAAGAAGAAAAAAGAAGAAAGGAPGAAPGVPAVPSSPQTIDAAVRVAANSAELLAEMLAPLKDGSGGGAAAGVGEPLITDLADQCYRHRSVLSEVIPRCEGEELLVAALAANDDLSRALATFEDLAGAPRGGGAASGGGAGAAAGLAAQPRGAGQLGGSGGGAGLLAGGAAANFSLLDEGDDEEAPVLATNRAPLSGRPSSGGAASAAPAAAAAASAAAASDLIDLDLAAIDLAVADPAPPAATATATPAPGDGAPTPAP